MEDKHYRTTYIQVGKGGNKASSLRVRLTALKAYIAFLRQRKFYGGMTRSQMTSLQEYVEEWSTDFTDMVAQRKTNIKRIKKMRQMTPSYMIKYGRPGHVKTITKQLENKNAGKPTIRFCQNVRAYLISKIYVMNGLRSSNIIEPRVEDVNDAEESVTYPGYFTFTNSLFSDLKLYHLKLRPILSQSSNLCKMMAKRWPMVPLVVSWLPRLIKYVSLINRNIQGFLRLR